IRLFPPAALLLALLPPIAGAPAPATAPKESKVGKVTATALTREQLSGLSLQDTYRTIADRSLSAVVSVYVEVALEESPEIGGDMDDFFNFFFGNPRRGKPRPNQPRERTQQAFGSGFLISEDGYLLSNDHVVHNARKITVKFANGTEYPAKVVGTDADTDLALLKIEGKAFTHLSLGDSDVLRVGDIVVAVGNPFGLQSTFTTGVVSAKGRTQLAEGPRFQNFIQTDVAINPGNSGGPLINIFGEVVGINSMILSRSGGSMGLSFSIPVNMAKEVIEQLKTKGSVTRGWLGVGVMDLTADKAKELDIPAKGVYLPEIYSNSPAEKAGLKPADILIEFNGKEIPNSQELVNLVGRTPPGTRITLTVLRANEKKQFTAVIETRPAQQTPSTSGGKADDGKPAPTPYLGLHVKEDKAGVVVTGMEDDSPFRGYDVRRGDLIYQVDYNTVANLADYTKFMDAAKAKGKAIVIFRRGNAVSYPFVVRFR
ncbi:MAG: Do family serine endopeptidase, partial [Spirochaetes bacterium]|nr:Do family serine endopeptidase [Spirochaetota bacterium]